MSHKKGPDDTGQTPEDAKLHDTPSAEAAQATEVRAEAMDRLKGLGKKWRAELEARGPFVDTLGNDVSQAILDGVEAMGLAIEKTPPAEPLSENEKAAVQIAKEKLGGELYLEVQRLFESIDGFAEQVRARLKEGGTEYLADTGYQQESARDDLEKLLSFMCSPNIESTLFSTRKPFGTTGDLEAIDDRAVMQVAQETKDHKTVVRAKMQDRIEQAIKEAEARENIEEMADHIVYLTLAQIYFHNDGHAKQLITAFERNELFDSAGENEAEKLETYLPSMARTLVVLNKLKRVRRYYSGD